MWNKLLGLWYVIVNPLYILLALWRKITGRGMRVNIYLKGGAVVKADMLSMNTSIHEMKWKYAHVPRESLVYLKNMDEVVAITVKGSFGK